MRTKLWLVALLLLGLTQVYGQCKTVVYVYDVVTGNLIQTISQWPGQSPISDPDICLPSNYKEYELIIDSENCLNGECSYPPKFTGANPNGNNYMYPGMLSNNNTSLTLVVFNNSTTSEASIQLSSISTDCDNLHFKGALRLCPKEDVPPPPVCDPLPLDKCLDYKILNCCDMECIKFNISCPTECENNCGCPECYFVTLLMEDGTVETINLNFAGQEYLMNCYSKKIDKVLSITAYECGGCPPETNGKHVAGSKIEKKQPVNKPDRIQVSPNPAKMTLGFKGDQLQNYKMSLYDDQSREVLSKVAISNAVNIEKLKRGIYIYVITDSAGYKQTGKIIKE